MGKSNLYRIVILAILLKSVLGLQAQTPNDAQMMEAKQACVLAGYSFSSFNHYWEGDLKRENETIATVHRQAYMPMMAVGILDDLDFYAGVPYIKTNSTTPNGGKFAGVSGFQDLSLAVKYRWLNKSVGKDVSKGRIISLAAVGFSMPITNYLSDYMPYSIGLGAPELTYRAIIQYETTSKWYVRAAGAYVWRGYTEAERNYYYNNGSYYTAWMDVPSAIVPEFVIGKWLLEETLKLELNYFGQRSLSGDDIRPYNAAQPTNKVNFDRVGLLGQYFFGKMPELGIVAYHHRIINGRNAPELSTTGGGITYFFNYLKK